MDTEADTDKDVNPHADTEGDIHTEINADIGLNGKTLFRVDTMAETPTLQNI